MTAKPSYQKAPPMSDLEKRAREIALKYDIVGYSGFEEEILPALIAALSVGEANEALIWLRAALDCKDFAWSEDQREAAEFAYSKALTPSTPGTRVEGLEDEIVQPCEGSVINSDYAVYGQQWCLRAGRYCSRATVKACVTRSAIRALKHPTGREG